jgi:hypothetical protein
MMSRPPFGSRAAAAIACSIPAASFTPATLNARASLGAAGSIVRR